MAEAKKRYPELDDLMDMKLHEERRIGGLNDRTEILRVPGGWIYKFYTPVRSKTAMDAEWVICSTVKVDFPCSNLKPY